MSLFEKDPSDEDFFTMDWSALIGGATISTSVWSVPTGLTQTATSNTTTTTTIKLSGGTADTIYSLPNTVTTSDGRTLQRSMNIKVVDK